MSSVLQETFKDAETAYWERKRANPQAYVPPARLAQILAQQQLGQQQDRSSESYQRLSWEALKKSLHGLVNKMNASNIRDIVPALFKENLIRGRGLFVRSMMRAQAQALPFTPVYAAVVAIINTKLPVVGELLLTRLILAFRRAYRRNDKPQCQAIMTFLSHLTNHRVAHELLVLQLMTLLLERPTDDSIEMTCTMARHCGQLLTEVAPRATAALFEQLRTVLHEGQLEKRVQYMVEVLFQLRKDKFKGHVPVPPELDLVEEEDQVTHYLLMDDDSLEAQDHLFVFKMDPDFLEHEAAYDEIRREILGDEGDEQQDENNDKDEVNENDADAELVQLQKQIEIQDQTNTDLVQLRKTIYLAIMSSINYEEVCHKLLKLRIDPSQEKELVSMVIECCSQERTFSRFYGFMAERFCRLDHKWLQFYVQCFEELYVTMHRYETNRIRNMAKLFGHCLGTEALPLGLFSCVILTEEDTTSASRIFIKILLQDLVEQWGLPRLRDQFMQVEEQLPGMFPSSEGDPSHLRFAINYYTSIGLGLLTESLRERLKEAMQKPQIESAVVEEEQEKDAIPARIERDQDSDASSILSSSSDEEELASRHLRDSRDSSHYSKKRSPSPRHRRDDSIRKRTRSPSPPRRRYDSPRTRRDSPPRRRDASPPRRRYDESPPPRHDSPPRRRDATPPRRRYDSPPPSKRYDESPPPRRVSPPRRRLDSPPRRRYDSPPPSKHYNASPPPRRFESPRRRRYDASPLRRRFDSPPRRRDSSPPRRRHESNHQDSRYSPRKEFNHAPYSPTRPRVSSNDSFSAPSALRSRSPPSRYNRQ